MNKISITNTTKEYSYGSNIVHAWCIIDRVKGLIGVKQLDEDSGLWLPKCGSIHTFFMSIPIDVIFLDVEMRIIKLVKNLGKNKICGCIHAAHVLELPAGRIEKSRSEIGDGVEVKNLDIDVVPAKAGI